MSVGVLRVKNWEKFQHYKHRSPPWIKLHRSLLDDRHYHALEDGAQSLLIALWLLASETGNAIPADSAALAWRLRRPTHDCERHLAQLLQAGLVLLEGELASVMLPPRGHDAEPETEKSRDRDRVEKSSVVTRPGEPGQDDLTDGQLMGMVRQHLYVPDGKAPRGYSDGRDVKIIRALRKRRLTGYQIADAIEGVRLMCDRGELGKKQRGEKLTMRCLFNTGHGVRPLLYQAQEAIYSASKARDRRTFPAHDQAADSNGRPGANTKQPEHISATIEKLVPTRTLTGRRSSSAAWPPT